MCPAETAKYIVTDFKMSEHEPEVDALYATYAKRVLRIGDDVVEGAFTMGIAWYLRPAPKGIQDRPHVHDTDEILGFFGSDPENPYDLGGEIEIWLEDDKHIIDRSAMIFVPAGMKHCPLVVTRVDRPIFHFMVVTSGQYGKKS